MIKSRLSMITAALSACIALSVAADDRNASSTPSVRDFAVEIDAIKAIREGRRTFRYATFGDEAFWGDTLGLHEAIAGAANGGVGPGVSPKTALSVGLKVDSAALPRRVQRALRGGELNLDDPAVTLELLRLDAVVGVTGFFDASNRLKAVGIQCALWCHLEIQCIFRRSQTAATASNGGFEGIHEKLLERLKAAPL